MTTHYKKIILSAASILLIYSTAIASILNIKSDETVKVDIIIEPGDGNLITTSDKAQKFTLNPGEEKEVKVENIEKDTFSITGKVIMPSLYNKCGPLLINKDYKIIFTGSNAGGTICISSPIDKK